MRVLATSTPGIGHLHALLPLLAALRSAGHDVVIVTGADACERVEQYGFVARAGGMTVAERRASFAPRLPAVMALPPRQRRAGLFSGFFAEAAAPSMRLALAPVFDEFRPDIVIHEMAELAAAPMATSRGLPHVTVAFSGALTGPAEMMLTDTISPVWAAEGLAAPTISEILGDLYLHPFPPAFAQVPAVDHVRPMRADGFDGPGGVEPPWLGEIGRGRPLVYLTSGTEEAAAMAPWAAAVEALGSLDVDAIVTIGMKLDPSIVGTVPQNVRVEQFVAQDLLLDRAAVVMSHAGAGSLLGAARRGVPQLLNPLFADQWDNADAATSAGVAITCEMDQRTTFDIGAALERLLHDGEYRAAASRVAAEIAAMPGPVDYVSALETLATGRTHRQQMRR